MKVLARLCPQTDYAHKLKVWEVKITRNVKSIAAYEKLWPHMAHLLLHIYIYSKFIRRSRNGSQFVHTRRQEDLSGYCWVYSAGVTGRLSCRARKLMLPKSLRNEYRHASRPPLPEIRGAKFQLPTSTPHCQERAFRLWKGAYFFFWACLSSCRGFTQHLKVRGKDHFQGRIKILDPERHSPSSNSTIIWEKMNASLY